jgi:hypothetical protein
MLDFARELTSFHRLAPTRVRGKRSRLGAMSAQRSYMHWCFVPVD